MVENEKNIYLKTSEPAGELYTAGLMKCLDTLSNYSSPTQKRKLAADLQLKGNIFNQAQYIQAACETTVTASIANSFPKSFRYEPKINPPSDVDCSFEVDGFHFNIEIKCPDYIKVNEANERDSFKIGSLGRSEGFHEYTDNLKSMFAEGGKALEVQHHMDNKLKDYLISAHNKFTSEKEKNKLNVILVCCDDPMDFQKWEYYMYGQYGLFTRESFWSITDYSNVDCVVLTNLHHRHYCHMEKSKIGNHWSLAGSFNLIYENTTTGYDKGQALNKLIETLPNFNAEIANYKCSPINSFFKVVSFVLEELQAKGRYFFEPMLTN